jgi:hypothetical protein
LPLHKQFARLEHAEHDDICYEIRCLEADEDDEELEDAPYIVAMSPSHDRRTKSHKPRQFADNDWDDVLELAAEWAEVALKEARARGGRREQRELGEQSWKEFVASRQQGPLALTTVTGIVDNDIPEIVEEGLRRVGVSDRRTAERVVDRIRGSARELGEVLERRGADVVEELGLIVLVRSARSSRVRSLVRWSASSWTG